MSPSTAIYASCCSCGQPARVTRREFGLPLTCGSCGSQFRIVAGQIDAFTYRVVTAEKPRKAGPKIASSAKLQLRQEAREAEGSSVIRLQDFTDQNPLNATNAAEQALKGARELHRQSLSESVVDFILSTDEQEPWNEPDEPYPSVPQL